MVIGSLLYYILFIALLLVSLPVYFAIFFLTALFDRSRVVLHYADRAWSMAIYAINPLWGVRVTGRENMQRGKTYVVVANHQSLLDIPLLLLSLPLHFKWVSKREVLRMPVFGAALWMQNNIVIRRGEAADAKKFLEQGRYWLGRGISVTIFPEGTRSPDCSIKRFHRGAFYLAEQLQSDIIPVMIHGAGHVLPKDDFMLRKGQIHIQVMPRITPDDTRFSTAYSPRAKEIRRYYQAEYEKMSREIETPAYYADLVLKNYIYKGAAIEREVRRNLQKNKYYTAEIAAMPDEGEVTITKTGYGEYALLLSFVKKDLQITAVEPDPDRLVLAKNGALISDNLRFV